MRLRTCNSRRKRLFCKQKIPKGKPFCYIVYGKRVAEPIGVPNSNEYGWATNWEVVSKEWERPFDNYPEAIVHLTRVKLAIDEEDAGWQHATPCKIVEGVYTKSGKEIITKIVRLNNECDRPPERHFGRRQSRSQGHDAWQLARRFGISLSEALEAVFQSSWSSGTTTSSSGLPAMDLARMHARGVSA